MEENEIGQRVLGLAIKVHKALGPGLLESAYEVGLAHELTKTEMNFERQLLLPLTYDGLVIDNGYRLDILVMGRVVLKIKTVEKLVDVHRAQLLSYLKLGGYRLGCLLNFNVSAMRDGIVRMVNGM